jgi:ADP-ribose pyrophosphatase
METYGLPADAKMVFKGEVYEVWQWQQTMFDGSVQTFERLKRPDTVNVIAVVDDKIIIEVQMQPHRRDPFLALPGGRCEAGEDPLAAAKREFLEETGYVSDDWHLWRDDRPFTSIIWETHTFIVRNCIKQQEQKLDAGERITISLVPFDEFIEKTQDPTFRHKELAAIFERAKLDPIFCEQLRKEILGK